METSAQAVEARVEADHWWFRGRRQLLAAMIRELNIRPDARTLDVRSAPHLRPAFGVSILALEQRPAQG